MNRFLNKKKATAAAATDEGSTSPPIGKEGKRWKKSVKKPAELEKPTLDLSSALPSSDDFRTSLIMPNLSARFSMLREQDDPNSKLGKASDDSVLQPRRQSRLADFGYAGTSQGLNDIAEVSSIHSSVRPPWLSRQHDSFVSADSNGDSESTATGSVMNRSRPGEGNNLFGGRQKVYKIPSSTSTKSLGKVVYENDVHTSSFQKHRQQEKEAADMAQSSFLDNEEESLGVTGLGIATTTTTDEEAAPSEHLLEHASYQIHHTQARPGSAESAATSAPSQARTSTPATSIASQNGPLTPASGQFPAPPKSVSTAAPQLERSLTKRRLYEQGLDQHLHEQQASNLTRMNSIQRQRTQPGTKLAQGSTFQNKFSNDIPEHSRPQSPPAEILTTFASMRSPGSNPSSPPVSHPQSPTTFPFNDYDDSSMLSSSIQPSDRGKATAMGAFSKPKQQFDEEQYLQRLQQMQQVREQPVQRSESSPKVSEESERSTKLARFDSARHTPEPTTLQSRRRSKSSPTKAEPSQAFSVFQRAAAHNVAVNSPKMDDGEEFSKPAPAPAAIDTHRTFFGDISASDDDDDDSIASDYEKRGYGLGGGRFPNMLPSVSEHPAMRSQNTGFDEIREEDEEDDLEEQMHYQQQPPAVTVQTMEPDEVDARNMNVARPDNKDMLRGLIQQHLRKPSDNSSIAPSVMQGEHLRNQSNQSSIYPATVGKEDSAPSLLDRIPGPARHTYLSDDNRVDSTYTNSNPWDLDDFDSSYYYGDSNGTEQDETVMPNQQVSDKTLSAKESNRSGSEAPWQGHTRDASTGTIQEREAFANELAARQKAIQENLRSIVEADSRSGSPQPTSSGALKAFHMLRPKSSRDSMARPEGQQNKAMKMLGLGAGAGSSSTLGHDDARTGAERQASTSSATKSASSQRTPPMNRQRNDSETSLRGRLPIMPNMSPQLAASQGRSRSNSAASSMRAQSRLRDEVERPGATRSPSMPQQFPPLPTQMVNEQQGPIGQARFRSGSRSNTPGISELPAQSIQSPPTLSGRMTPSGPLSAPINPNQRTGNSVPARPGLSPYPASSNGPLSAPGSYYRAPPAPAPAPTTARGTGQLLRKKTVRKNEISEPTLISSTSNVDTVDLPPGASLRNGMDQVDAPAPPKRTRTQKLFNLRRDSPSEERPININRANAVSPPLTAPANFGQLRSPERPERTQMKSYHGGAPAFHRPQPRAMRSDESFERPPFQRPAPPERPLMTEGGMF